MKILLKYILILVLSTISISSYAQYDRDVFFYRGRRALADGKYALAIENFNILHQLDSTDYLTVFYRGIAKYNLGDIRGARLDFNTAVRQNPVFTPGYHYRGITESRFGNYEKAIKNIQKAISLRPSDESLYYSRGVTYFLSRQFNKAIEDFDKYIHREPKDPSAFLNRGACFLYVGDTLKALKDYNKAIEIDRFQPDGYIRRGRVYAAKGDFNSALKDMNMAIRLDSTNTFAYFNRAIMYFDREDYNKAMFDLNRVLRDEPGNALTLYNRSLLHARVGDYNNALSDMNRVIRINPKNVLAYFNRASYFIQMKRWKDALKDYNMAISLYPDFAKAYLNRSFVENMLGRTADSKKDYNIAQKKIKDYREKTDRNLASFADTTKKYNSLLALDADFAKKDFNNELLQHRDIDIRLKPLYKFILANKRETPGNNLSKKYSNPLINKFIYSLPLAVKIQSKDSLNQINLDSVSIIIAKNTNLSGGRYEFIKALYNIYDKQFNTALDDYNAAIASSYSNKYERFYKAFYYMNRGVLRADMIDFMSSIDNNIQILTIDDKKSSRARVKDEIVTHYDYSQAITDMQEALSLVNDIPYIHFNLGNLYCLSSKFIEALNSYSTAIKLYPYMGNAYYNRGLLLIYLKDKEKGCIDLSRAGELGVVEAYSVINKYCKEDKE